MDYTSPSTPLTSDGTLMKESDDIDILGATLDSRRFLKSFFAQFQGQLLKDLVS